MVLGFDLAELFVHLRAALRDKCSLCGFVIRRVAQQLFGELAPAVEPFAESGQILRRIVRIAVVGEKKSRGLATQDGSEGLVPDFQIDVGRRSGRQNEGPVVDMDAPGVADESDAVGIIKIADMVAGVTRGVFDVDVVRAQWNRFAPFENAKVFFGYGKKLA